MTRGAPFAAGDACLVYDPKGRKYLIDLIPGRTFQSHRGTLAHDEIIGSQSGEVKRSSKDTDLVILRPRLADYVLKMGRGPTVLYPKDAGPLLVWADVGPGMAVVEAGTGSGGLAMMLARAVGSGGTVLSVERRRDHSDLARKRIAGFFGEVPPQLVLAVGDVEPVITEERPDRVILDVPEPWHSVEPSAAALPGGGIFACFLPTVPQVQQVRDAIDGTGMFLEISTFEVLQRDWAVDGRSVRPEHRMIGHTGFVTVARRVLRSTP